MFFDFEISDIFFYFYSSLFLLQICGIDFSFAAMHSNQCVYVKLRSNDVISYECCDIL